MDTRTLLEQLRNEHAELGKAIALLERRTGASGSGSQRRALAPKRHIRLMSATAKAAMSRKLKAVWAAKKKDSATRSKATKARATKKAAQ